MAGFQITASQKNVQAAIELPSSKSLSNRALVLQHVIAQLTHDHLLLRNLSMADDTAVMINALQQQQGELNVKNAGTCMRFLTAYYAATPGTNLVLTGNERMLQRPIAPLVDMLRGLGAHIVYKIHEGFAPLHIIGKKLRGARVSAAGEASSQFTSALMMAAPLFTSALHIQIENTAVSMDYIRMTAALMEQLGFSISIDNEAGLHVHIDPGSPVLPRKIIVMEADWSSAAFLYQAAALATEAKIKLPGLTLNSLQGDKVIARLMLPFGVHTTEMDDHIIIEKRNEQLRFEPATIDLKNHPDLAPPLVCTAAALGAPYTFTGLESLRVKESDRLQALQGGLLSLGYGIELIEPGTLKIVEPTAVGSTCNNMLQTHDDHRLVMCFALLALRRNDILISEISSVIKSFPGFWHEVAKAGIHWQ